MDFTTFHCMYINTCVELPKLEVTRRVENRSSKVARKSKGLSRPNPTPSPSPPRFLFEPCCRRFLLDQSQPTRFLQWDTQYLLQNLLSLHYKCVAEKITKSADRIWSDNSLTLWLCEPLQRSSLVHFLLTTASHLPPGMAPASLPGPGKPHPPPHTKGEAD